MLKPTIKQEGSTIRERYLAKLAGNSFFGMWTYPNVYTDEGFSKNKIGEELCDLLVVFDDNVILFSDKDIKFNDSIDAHVGWRRWFKRAVDKSCKQLYGAESWIKKNPSRIYLDKKCTIPFPLDLSGDLNIYLVAVTCNTIDAAKKYFGNNSSSSFYQLYNAGVRESFERPFQIGWLYPEKRYIHVLDEASLDLLLSELDTIFDFVNYLYEKESVIQQGALFAAAGEEEILACYYREQERTESLVGSIGAVGVEGYDKFFLAEGLWLEYKTQGGLEKREFYRENSKFWDSFIHDFSRHILTGVVGLAKDQPFSAHEKAIRFLAAECRASRVFLSKALIEKIQEVPENRRSARIVESLQNRGLFYIFIVFPRSKPQSDEDNRLERLGYNHSYSLVAKYLFPEMKNIVVIANDYINEGRRSEDVVAYDFDRELTKEELLLAKELHEYESILSNISKYKDSSLFGTFGKQPYRNKDKVYRRNGKCPCGSGKKYKKCCMP